VTYDDVGDRGGAPVVYLHGGGDSRLSRHPDDSIAAQLGVRLVAVDRCGPPVRGRTLRSCASEVISLLDELGVDRAAVVGWSAGGPHALAIAATAPDRVERVALVASLPPPHGTRVLPEDVRRVMRLARLSVPLAARALEAWGRRPTPPTGDRVTDTAYARGRIEAFAHGGAWLARELAYLARPWGFEAADVHVPVTLWWGDRDRVTPPSIALDYARVLPESRLRIVEGTHQLLFSRWRDILADAAAPATVSPRR
jgi:pimeloyl-ACP methyl ester carboxylesterase